MAKPLLGLRKDGICVDVNAWVLAESIIDNFFAVKLVGEVPLGEGTTEVGPPRRPTRRAAMSWRTSSSQRRRSAWRTEWIATLT